MKVLNLMYKYHGYIILNIGDRVSIHDPDRELGDRIVHTTDSLDQAMIWIDEQNLAKQKENVK